MSKHIEKLKKQLMDISEVVNSFKSEAVQVKIIDKLFDAMAESEKGEEGYENGKKSRRHEDNEEHTRKKPGATKILNQLLSTEFFAAPQSISSIADFCKDNFDSSFK